MMGQSTLKTQQPAIGLTQRLQSERPWTRVLLYLNWEREREISQASHAHVSRKSKRLIHEGVMRSAT